MADVVGEYFAGVDSGQEELEVVAIFGDAEATLDEGTYLERLMAGGVAEGRGVGSGSGLSGGVAGNGQQDDEGPDGGCSDTRHGFRH